MPPALYCVKTGEKYESKEQMLSMRRENDNKKQKSVSINNPIAIVYLFFYIANN